ncbi:hypothetical protein EUGRSUZ_B02336 [Eucalyptus grandis]|uniref:Uncharacterized protein n=2 Tax=Eucalyptus grandis TaxID=71139 RepID=A0ACC3LSQ8_EUCGR|nr:hypothetical protein EUGRSUZ_B02336 [Eucalyptus grandis]
MVWVCDCICKLDFLLGTTANKSLSCSLYNVFQCTTMGQMAQWWKGCAGRDEYWVWNWGPVSQSQTIPVQIR